MAPFVYYCRLPYGRVKFALAHHATLKMAAPFFVGMSGFDRWIKLSFVCMPRLIVLLVNANNHLTSANLLSRAKNALVNAFTVPTLATAVA